MKRIYRFSIIISLLGALNTGYAQLRKLPAEVTEAFKAKYPGTKNAEWKDKLTSFVVNFDMQEDRYAAKFSNKGEWLQTEKEIAAEALPAEVKEGLGKSKYSGWELQSIALIEHKDNAIQYKLLVRKNDIERKYLFFDKEGRLLRDVIAI
jgi:hypothetical protein